MTSISRIVGYLANQPSICLCRHLELGVSIHVSSTESLPHVGIWFLFVSARVIVLLAPKVHYYT